MAHHGPGFRPKEPYSQVPVRSLPPACPRSGYIIKDMIYVYVYVYVYIYIWGLPVINHYIGEASNWIGIRINQINTGWFLLDFPEWIVIIPNVLDSHQSK